jgi:hypothetical protein
MAGVHGIPVNGAAPGRGCSCRPGRQGEEQSAESSSACSLLTAAEVQRYFGPSVAVDPTASGDDEDASDLFVSGPIHNGACVWKLPGSKLRELELNLRWLPAPQENAAARLRDGWSVGVRQAGAPVHPGCR